MQNEEIYADGQVFIKSIWLRMSQGLYDVGDTGPDSYTILVLLWNMGMIIKSLHRSFMKNKQRDHEKLKIWCKPTQKYDGIHM